MPIDFHTPLEVQLRKVFDGRITVEQEPWPGPINIMDRRGRWGWLFGKKLGYVYDMRRELGPYRIFTTPYKDVADRVNAMLPDLEVALIATESGFLDAGIEADLPKVVA